MHLKRILFCIALTLILNACGGGGGGGTPEPSPTATPTPTNTPTPTPDPVDTDNDGIPDVNDPDDDNDGVDDSEDAFPLNPDEQFDTDNDGVGDNADFYPEDASCHRETNGNGETCYLTWLANKPSKHVSISDTGEIYFVLQDEKLVLKFDPASQEFIYSSTLAENLTSLVQLVYSSAHQRLYLLTQSGELSYISESNGQHLPAAAGVTNIDSIAAAGQYLYISDGEYHYTFTSDFVQAAYRSSWTYSTRDAEWNENTSRIYYITKGVSPNDLLYETINQANGTFIEAGETPHHGDYLIVPPIRVSPTGQYVLLGSGDIYDSEQDLTWSGTISETFEDALWLEDNSLVLFENNNQQTHVKRLSNNTDLVEYKMLSGNFIAAKQTSQGILLILETDEALSTQWFVPSDDSDNDGVNNTDDDFPLDPAASKDSDNDGYPDAWNDGFSESDSTTGLVLDAFPDNSACFSVEQGVDGVCDVSATMPDFTADQIIHDENGVIYLLSSVNQRVYRWSSELNAYLSPLVANIEQGAHVLTPTHMTFSSDHQRIYFAYTNGAIRYISVEGSNRKLQSFASVAGDIGGIASAGKFLLVQDDSGAWATHYVFDKFGTLKENKDWNYRSQVYTWSPTDSRLYFFSHHSPPDLQFEQINQTTGTITAEGETPHHGDYSIAPPIRVSQNGRYVLLGSGDIYDKTDDLRWAASLGRPLKDAAWNADGSLTILTQDESNSAITRLSVHQQVFERRVFSGAPQALVPSGDGESFTVVTLLNGTTAFHRYTPSNDSDNDGVDNINDAFPLDPAASVDTDHDGYPDAWNDGYGAEDSTTGLSLDAYPEDSACYLAQHGDGNACDYSATMPSFTPTSIFNDGTTLFLFSQENQRIYRWSTEEKKYLNPLVVGMDLGYGQQAPRRAVYSEGHGRIYLGYESGQIRYLNTSENSPEIHFANVGGTQANLTAAGNFVFAYDGSYFVFDRQGARKDYQDWGTYSAHYAWNESDSRLYHLRDNTSPNNLLYIEIDQTSGQITTTGSSPYHGDYTVRGPIRISPDGQYVLLGSGDIYDAQNSLNWAGSISGSVNDALWLESGLITATNVNNEIVLQRFDNNLSPVEAKQFDGQVLALQQVNNRIHLVAKVGDAIVFYLYEPSDDSDGDGVNNPEDAFPLDAAASVDSDFDGYPDNWNDGYTEQDSTTGLTLDAYPNDSACYLSEHGDGSVCDYTATMPEFSPDKIFFDDEIIYLFSEENKRIYRWSKSDKIFVNPIIAQSRVGFEIQAPTTVTYAKAQQRIYLGYSNGKINFIDLDKNFAQIAFAQLSRKIVAMEALDQYLFVKESATWFMQFLLNKSGVITDQKESYDYASDHQWDAVNSRLYFRNSTYGLGYQQVDKTAGTFGETFSNHYSNSNLQTPLRINDDSRFILLGNGEIFDINNDLTWYSSLGADYLDLSWVADDGIVGVFNSANNISLERFNADLTLAEQVSFDGEGLALIPGNDAPAPTDMTIVAKLDGAFVFYEYTANNDTDGDGVENNDDAFPQDAAASVDEDHDGYPDTWNEGYDENDSTTGLTLDAYPNATACYLPEHGDGLVCDYASTIPSFTPDKVILIDDVLHLLSKENKRIYRWSVTDEDYIDALKIGLQSGANQYTPDMMEYSAAHDRIYLGYTHGIVTYIDLTSPSAETVFVSTHRQTSDLAIAGNFIMVESSDYDRKQAIYNVNGVLTDSNDNSTNYYYAWNENQKRLYFIRDYSSSYIYYLQIDPSTGQITEQGQTDYSSEYRYAPPLFGSEYGDKMLTGSGHLVDTDSLSVIKYQELNIHSAYLFDDIIVVLRDSETQSHIELRDSESLEVIDEFIYNSSPIALLADGYDLLLLHQTLEGMTFTKILLDDHDQDGMPAWWENYYGLDDGNADDGALDTDEDGLSNVEEYVAGSNPNVIDSDGDTLTDADEVSVYKTHPNKKDTDGDQLSDDLEVLSYNTDPLDIDTDNDSYTDGEEALGYNTNPNSATSIPKPIASLTESFESDLNVLWQETKDSDAPWYFDSSESYDGARSLRSGTLEYGEYSIIEYRNLFAQGILSFNAKLADSNCCDRLQVYVDGEYKLTIDSGDWQNYSIRLNAGAHTITWSYYQNYGTSSSTYAAIIDNLTFEKD